MKTNQLHIELPGDNGPLFQQPEEEIRALSFWQPFGFLMLHGKHETRLWDTKYRGLVLICTTKTPLEKQPLDKTRHIMFSQYHKFKIEQKKDEEQILQNNRFPTALLNGYAIALGRLSESRRSLDADKTYFEHYNIQRPIFTHIYEDVKRIVPFPIKGGQGWFKVTPEIRAKIKLLE